MSTEIRPSPTTIATMRSGASGGRRYAETKRLLQPKLLQRNTRNSRCTVRASVAMMLIAHGSDSQAR